MLCTFPQEETEELSALLSLQLTDINKAIVVISKGDIIWCDC